MNFFNKKSLYLFLVFVIIFYGYYFYTKRSNEEVLENPVNITFSPKWVNQAQFAGIFIAKDLGYYEKSGINLNIKEFKLGGSVLEDLKSGKSQLGLMSANEFLVNYSKGEPIKAVAAFYQVSPFMLASLKSNPVNSPAEMKGKRLGIKGGEGAEGRLVYDLLLASAGLSENDVTFVYLPLGTPEMEDLTSGKVDVIGFYRDELFHFNKAGISYVPIYPEQYGSALYNDILVTSNGFAEQHGDAIKLFIKNTIKGWKYAYKNKEEAINTTLKYVTSENYKDVEYEKYILDKSEDLMTSQVSSSIGEMELSRWQKFYEALNSHKLLEKSFDVKDSFTTEFLP